MVLGAFTDADVPAGRPSFSVREVLEHYFGEAGCPVVLGWNYGHFPVKVPMPIGVRVRLECGPGGVELVTQEPLVAPAR